MFKPMVYSVLSETNKKKAYHVTNYRPHRFTCDCPDYLYRSHDKEGYSTGHKCKHIKKIIAELKSDLETYKADDTINMYKPKGGEK